MRGGGFKSQFQRPLMVGLIDIKYFYLQVKMSKMIPESYNQFAAPLGHGSGTWDLLSSVGLKMSITSLNFNYVKPCLDLVQL